MKVYVEIQPHGCPPRQFGAVAASFGSRRKTHRRSGAGDLADCFLIYIYVWRSWRFCPRYPGKLKPKLPHTPMPCLPFASPAPGSREKFWFSLWLHLASFKPFLGPAHIWLWLKMKRSEGQTAGVGNHGLHLPIGQPILEFRVFEPQPYIFRLWSILREPQNVKLRQMRYLRVTRLFHRTKTQNSSGPMALPWDRFPNGTFS